MKIVFLLSRFPYPLEKGDKLRAYQHIVNMFNSGHEVHLIALSDTSISAEHLSKIEPYCHSIKIFNLSYCQLFLNLLGSFSRNLPLQVGYFYSPGIQAEIEKIIYQIKPDLVYCQLIRTATYISNIKAIPKLIDYQDAFSQGTEQRLKQANWLYQPLFKREYNLVKAFEKKSYDRFQGHLIISEQDRQAIAINSSKKIDVVPNGIDTDFFKPLVAEKEFDITFVGNMNYPPNIDGSNFLVKEIMPLVWKKFPKARVQLAGAQPGKKVLSLASDRVVVTGWVDDIRECYSKSKIFIAPMRIGTGLQNKLLEAMAMQLPCITTPISFEPLKAERNSEILVGENSNELANHLINLLEQPVLAAQIANDGHKFILKNYSMIHSRQLLNEILVATVKK